MKEAQTQQFYTPGSVNAETLEQLALSVLIELEEISNALVSARAVGQYDPQTKLPPTPQNGMIGYFAAGVAGPALGFYGYENGAWVKL